ncbi:MAG: hypothetical protein R2702_03080 [Acidimicrobiales bacterium]
MGAKRNRRALARAMGEGDPVSLRRNLWRAARPTGFVVGLGERWAVLHLLDRVVLDGWAVVRLDTVSEVEALGHHHLGARALRLRHEAPADLGVDLGTTRDLLADLAERFPIVEVHTEALDPDRPATGRPVRLGPRRVHLLDIDADAVWDHAPRRFAYGDITRLDVGGRVAEALHDLGGYPPVPG